MLRIDNPMYFKEYHVTCPKTSLYYPFPQRLKQTDDQESHEMHDSFKVYCVIGAGNSDRSPQILHHPLSSLMKTMMNDVVGLPCLLISVLMKPR